jgi:hypothetical protein
MPAVEASGNIDPVERLIRVCGCCDEQISKSPIERRRRDEPYPRSTRAGIAQLDHRLERGLLRRDVEIRNTGAQRSIDERQRGIEKRSGAVNDGVRAADRCVELLGVVDGSDAPWSRVPGAAFPQARGIAPYPDNAEATPL